MGAIRRHWITGLAVLLGLFMLFLAVAFAVGDESEVSTAERVFGITVNVILGFSLLGGLFMLRNGTVSPNAALSAIGFGLIGGFIWFWMLIPPLVAFAVLWFGIVRRGLVRELVVPAT